MKITGQILKVRLVKFVNISLLMQLLFSSNLPLHIPFRISLNSGGRSSFAFHPSFGSFRIFQPPGQSGVSYSLINISGHFITWLPSPCVSSQQLQPAVSSAQSKQITNNKSSISSSALRFNFEVLRQSLKSILFLQGGWKL